MSNFLDFNIILYIKVDLCFVLGLKFYEILIIFLQTCSSRVPVRFWLCCVWSRGIQDDHPLQRRPLPCVIQHGTQGTGGDGILHRPRGEDQGATIKRVP